MNWEERLDKVNKRNIGILSGCLVLTTAVTLCALNTDNKEQDLAKSVPNAGISCVLENYSMESDEHRAEISALITQTVMAANGSANTTDSVTEQQNVAGTENSNVTESVLTEETSSEEPVSEQSTEVQSEEATTLLNSESTTAEKVTEETTVEEPTTEEPTTEAPSIYDTIAMSQVDNYVNVRSMPSTDGEILGKIYNNCAATIIETVGDWYKIESGSVSGYIKAEYFVTGDAAEQVAINCGYVYATVTTPVLNVRAGQGTDSELLTQIPEGEQYDVVEYGDGWVYLAIDGDVKGWVSMDYVDIAVEFDTAISLEEERIKKEEEARLAREAAEAARIAEEARRAAQAAAAERERQEAQAAQQAAQQAYESTAADSDAAAAMRNAVVAYALQFVGNPYVYGGTSLTNGTDCSGFTMSVYKNFGYGLNRTSRQQASNGYEVSTSELLPGDLLFYSNGGSGIGHVALYIGNGQVVHASTPSTGIKISSYMYRTPITARRIIG